MPLRLSPIGLSLNRLGKHYMFCLLPPEKVSALALCSCISAAGRLKCIPPMSCSTQIPVRRSRVASKRGNGLHMSAGRGSKTYWQGSRAMFCNRSRGMSNCLPSSCSSPHLLNALALPKRCNRRDHVFESSRREQHVLCAPGHFSYQT